MDLLRLQSTLIRAPYGSKAEIRALYGSKAYIRGWGCFRGVGLLGTLRGVTVQGLGI